MILIIFGWGNQPERINAGIYILLYTLIGSLPLLIILLFLRENRLQNFFVFIYRSERNIILRLFLIFAFLVKIPIYIFHLWLPKAHVEAPVAGSMILAGVILKLGGYGFYKVINLISGLLWGLSEYFIRISLVGSIYVRLLCLVQVDIKSLIAYSSVSHIGLVIGGLITLRRWSSYGVILIILGHGLCSSGLFFIVNLFYERIYSRNIIILKGLMTLFPSLNLGLFILFVINIGAPPSINLLGEIILMGGIINWEMICFLILGLISFFSAAYSLYIYSFSLHGKFWNLSSINIINIREYNIVYIHIFPLVLFVIKGEIFILW